MDLHEYLDQVTQQMRCKKARDMVAGELENHIEDQAETYEKFGLPREEAMARAVEQMGDPIEVGTSMDRIHRPRINYRMLGLIALLTVFGMLMQIMMLQSEANAGMGELFGKYRADILEICTNGVLGFGVMLLVMFVDYSFLGKHPLAVWGGILLVLFSVLLLDMNFYGMGLATTNMSVLTSLLALFFAALVYHYRNQRYKGILLCLLWLFAGCFLLSRQMGISLACVICLFLVCILVISFSVGKGWFGVPVRKGLLLLWSVWLVPAAGIAAAVAAGAIGANYQTARIRYFLNPYQEPYGGGYVPLFMRERLRGLHLVGSSLSGEETWWYSLNYILERYGILLGVLVLAVLALLLGSMLSGVVKQQNRLGSLLGVSCVGYLAVTTLLHVLTSLTLVPATSAYLPFFTGGRTATVGQYLLLGVYLSVYRNSRILSEKSNEPKKRLRLRVENVNPMSVSPK